MRKVVFLPLIALLGAVAALPVAAQQTISTVAGGPLPTLSVSSIGLLDPLALAYDQNGKLLVGDCTRLYRLDGAGNASQIAGAGGGCEDGFGDDPGDGGPALAASVEIAGMVVAANGDIYFTDNAANEIRVLSAATGNITAFAGTGVAGFSGDGGPAQQAQFNLPWGLVQDSAGNFYVTDGNNRVREISASGVVSTLAAIDSANTLALDGSGNLYVGSFSGTVSRIQLSNDTVTIVAGGGTQTPTAGLAATSAGFSNVRSVYSRGGNLYFAGAVGSSTVIWEVPAGQTNLVAIAGGGSAFSATGPATASKLSGTDAIVGSPDGGLILTSHNGYILHVGSDGTLSAVLGNGTFSTVAGLASNASLITPGGVFGYANPAAVYADLGANQVLTIQPGSFYDPVVGTGIAGYSGDGGEAMQAQLRRPSDVLLDGANDYFIADSGNNVIREVSGATGIISTYAGNGTSGYSGDGGPATGAQLSNPSALALDSHGNLYILDQYTVVRRVDAVTHTITTVAGQKTAGNDSGDGGSALTAVLNGPQAIALDAVGNLYIADSGFYYAGSRCGLSSCTVIADATVRRVDAQTGLISTVAGVGDPGGNPPTQAVGSGDGGPATLAGLTLLSGIAVDANGNLYLGDFGGARVRLVVAATGIIYTLAGNGKGGVSGDGGPPPAAELRPGRLNLDPWGNLWVSDDDSGRIRLITDAIGQPVASANSLAFDPQLLNTPDPTQTLTLTNPGPAPLTISAITAGGDYAASNNCATLAAGASCTVTVAFTPTALGYRPGTLAIGNSVAPMSVPLDGFGATPATATPGLSSLTFGPQAGGSGSAGQSIVVNNTGGMPLTVQSIAVSTGFTETNTCGAQLESYSNCIITVSFSPTAAGAATGTLTINDSAAGSPQTIALSGTAVAAAPAVTLFPPTLTFTNQAQGATSPAQAVWLVNSGTAALSLASIAASGDFAQTNACPTSLAPDAGCVVSVTFTPTASGARTGALTVTDGAGDSPEVVALAGAGPTAPPVITTVAGGGPQYLPEADTAFFDGVRALAYDAAGDTFIATGRQVLKRSPQGLVTLVAGILTSVANSSNAGDGGPATAASLGNIGRNGLAVDAKGDIFVAASNVVREITPDGRISTVAGTFGAAGFSGDGGPATQAQLNHASGLALDSAGDLFIADRSNQRVREVNAATGVITTFAGNGTRATQYGFFSGPATSNSLCYPEYVAVDQAGDVFIKGCEGLAEVAAGSANIVGYGTGGSFVDAGGNSYGTGTTDSSGETIWKEGVILAGGGSTPLPAALGGAATAAQLGSIAVTSVSPGGIVTFASGGYVLQVDANGNLQALAGNGNYSDSADQLPALGNSFYGYAIAEDASGNLYIADAVGDRVRELVAATGELITVAGNGTFPSSGPGAGDGGPATQAQVQPNGLTIDAAGDLYISDPYDVRMVNARTGFITTVAGTGVSGSGGDGGPATQAQLGAVSGLALDRQGNLYLADGGISVKSKPVAGTARVREVNASTGVIETVAGGGAGALGDGGPATSASLIAPRGLAFDAAGNLYIADAGDLNGSIGVPADGTSLVREVNASTGVIATVAGGGTGAGNANGDGGPATEATLGSAVAVRLDQAGNLFIADQDGFAVRRVDAASGNISTVAGTGVYTLSGDGGPATEAAIGAPYDLALDAAGNLFVASEGTIRKVANAVGLPWVSPSAMDLGQQTVGAASAAQTLTLTNPGSDALAIASVAVSSGASAGFAVTSNCGTAIAAGATCTVAVTFTPAALGPATGTLTLTPATGNPLTVALSGSGIAAVPQVGLAPTTLTFAGQATNSTSAAQSVTLINSGTAALAITAIAAGGDFAATNTCGTSLAPGAQCAIAVTFTPTATGARTASLTVTDNAADSPQTVALSGTGADLTIAPAAGSTTTTAVAAGQPAVFALAFTPVSGLSGSFALTCSGAPTGAACMPSPATISLSGTVPVPVTVTVTTTARSVFVPLGDSRLPSNPEWVLLAGLLAILLFAAVAWAHGPRGRRALLAGAGCCLFGLLAACGSNSSQQITQNSNPAGTPAGTYILTVTATSPTGVTRSTQLTLTIH
jgi:hypothetical protein